MNCILIAKIAIILAAQAGLFWGLSKDANRINEDPSGDNIPGFPASTDKQLSQNVMDINRLSTAPIDDPSSLWALQLELLAMAEALFGPRYPSYQLYQPQFYEEGPNLRFGLDQQGVWAEISCNGRFYWPTVVYELALETVHLLNPGLLGTANNLEEGVAVAFSLHAQTQYGVDVQVPAIPSYVYAVRLVDKLPGDILSDAALIRRELGQLRKVTPQDSRRLFPGLDARIAHELTRKFIRDADPTNSGNS